jgi:hypothetical protein
LSTYATPSTIPHTLLSTNATPNTNPHTPSEAPLTQSSPCQRRRHNIPTPNLSETDDNRRRPRHHYPIPSIATQQNDTPPPNIPSRYTQTFNIMTLVYSPRLTLAKIITVLQIGDKFIRDDAFMFLKDLLPL